MEPARRVWTESGNRGIITDCHGLAFVAAGRPLVRLKPKYGQAEFGGAEPGVKMSMISAVCLGVIVAVLLFCFWPLLDHPWLFGAYTDIDINSGDTRHQTRVFSLAVKMEVEESELSREVRRLGIDIPPTRAWQRAFEGHLVNNSHIDYSYGSVVTLCHTLPSILSQVNASDEERRAILETLMTSLRKGDPRKTHDEILLLMAEVGERHSLDVLTSEATDYVTRLRDAR